jgi:hypothetical protein
MYVHLCQDDDTSWGHSVLLGTLPDIAQWVSSFGWSWIIHNNKTVIVSLALFWVLWVILAHYWTCGDRGNPHIWCQLFGSAVASQGWSLWLMAAVRGVSQWNENCALNLDMLAYFQVLKVRTTCYIALTGTDHVQFTSWETLSYYLPIIAIAWHSENNSLP